MKPDDVSQEAWDKAQRLAELLNDDYAIGGASVSPVAETIARAIMAARAEERARCLDICAAEREWGSGIEEVQLLVASGGPARVIPGWNAPSEE